MLRKIIAGVLDFITIFVLAGVAVGYFTGNLTENGFELYGWPALLTFAIMIGYFAIFQKYLGGTIWRYILRVPAS